MICIDQSEASILTAEGLVLPGEEVEAPPAWGEIAPVAQLAALPIPLSTRETLTTLKLEMKIRDLLHDYLHQPSRMTRKGRL